MFVVGVDPLFVCLVVWLLVVFVRVSVCWLWRLSLSCVLRWLLPLVVGIINSVVVVLVVVVSVVVVIVGCGNGSVCVVLVYVSVPS